MGVCHALKSGNTAMTGQVATVVKHISNDLKNCPSLFTGEKYNEFGIRVKGLCYINKKTNCLGYILSWTQKIQAPAVQNQTKYAS